MSVEAKSHDELSSTLNLLIDHTLNQVMIKRIFRKQEAACICACSLLLSTKNLCYGLSIKNEHAEQVVSV